ncbi:MAG: hypothetical protein V4486_01175 [Patescibacteria group bacterium]
MKNPIVGKSIQLALTSQEVLGLGVARQLIEEARAWSKDQRELRAKADAERIKQENKILAAISREDIDGFYK